MCLFRKKWRFITFIISIFTIVIWLSIELYNPSEIVCTFMALPGGIETFGAPDLVIQHVSKDATIWSVRGYWVYKSSDGIKFKKAFKVPCGSLISWLGNLRLTRVLTGHTELCEIFPLRSGTILTFSGGYIWRSTDGGNTFRQVHELNHFGIGHGRGVMPQGMAEDDEGGIYYGEYFRNLERGAVFVYRSLDDGRHWKVIYQYKPGEIRHIHSLQFDPYTNKVWITTGDSDHECIIGFSTDKGKTFQRLFSGSQRYRAVSLLFTENAVFWGSDSPQSQNWIYRFDRQTRDVKQICKVGGPIYYSTLLSDGTLIMGRTVEGHKGEWDDVVSIWLSKDGNQWTKNPLGKRKTSKRYAVLRFPKGRFIGDLYTTALNTMPYEDVLLKIPNKNIIK